VKAKNAALSGIFFDHFVHQSDLFEVFMPQRTMKHYGY
jgi:hypothetical protein